MMINEYKKIIRTERQGYRTYYEYTVDGMDRILWEEYIDLCGGYTDCHIITMDNEKWIGYYDTRNGIIYIDAHSEYTGISNKVLEALTQHLGWTDYKVYVQYYNYEESILAISDLDLSEG